MITGLDCALVIQPGAVFERHLNCHLELVTGGALAVGHKLPLCLRAPQDGPFVQHLHRSQGEEVGILGEEQPRRGARRMKRLVQVEEVIAEAPEEPLY